MRAISLLNLAAYSLQLAVLVASAAVAARVLRLQSPRPALHYWQGMLAAALLLPFVQGGTELPADVREMSATIAGYRLAASSLPWSLSQMGSVVVAVLTAGAAIRLAWLGLGLVRLSAIRRRSTALQPASHFVGDLASQLGSAGIHLSDDVDGPVTTGVRRPLVLLPRRTLGLPLPLQRAIVCHELIHVRRHDWVYTVAEQVWCALLWFHPAAPLLVSRVGLMREALVDRETVALTGDRRAYAQALLAFAEPIERTPVAVVPLIRPRHLSRRIALITQEVPMSHRHITAALVVGIATVSAATAASVSRFPMSAAPSHAPAVRASSAQETQEEAVRPGQGVTLPRPIKEVRPKYTPAAMEAKIHGEVEMDIVVLPNGDPGEIVISRSLDAVYGLDDAAMQAASQWKFEPGRRDGKAVPVLITLQMTFTLRDRK